jgi:hypothetical protein
MEIKMELFKEIADFTRYSCWDHDDRGKGIIDPYRYHLRIKQGMGEALKKKIDSDFWRKFISPMKEEPVREPCMMIPDIYEKPGMVKLDELYNYLKEHFHAGEVIKIISGEKNLDLLVLKLENIVLPVKVTELEIPINRVDVGNNIQVFTHPNCPIDIVDIRGHVRGDCRSGIQIFTYPTCEEIHQNAIMLANDSYGFAYRRK